MVVSFWRIKKGLVLHGHALDYESFFITFLIIPILYHLDTNDAATFILTGPHSFIWGHHISALLPSHFAFLQPLLRPYFSNH